MFEKRNVWSKRLAHPVIIALDKTNLKLLSGEFVSRINPESYYIPENAIAVLLCSDERLNEIDLASVFKDKIQDSPIFPIRIPGSGAGQDLPKLIKAINELGFSKIAATAHAGCGAVNGNDQQAKDIVKSLEKLGVENWGFIDGEMCPSLEGFHPGVCLLVDGTGHRNNQSDSVLPENKFFLNRKMYNDPQLASSHIRLLTSIALGHHGIGMKDEDQNFGFSPSYPFYIFIAAYNDVELRKYMDEAGDAVASFPENVVKIVGFLAPKAG